jgi:hypothetical protein
VPAFSPFSQNRTNLSSIQWQKQMIELSRQSTCIHKEIAKKHLFDNNLKVVQQ